MLYVVLGPAHQEEEFRQMDLAWLFYKRLRVLSAHGAGATCCSLTSSVPSDLDGLIAM